MCGQCPCLPSLGGSQVFLCCGIWELWPVWTDTAWGPPDLSEKARHCSHYFLFHSIFRYGQTFFFSTFFHAGNASRYRFLLLLHVFTESIMSSTFEIAGCDLVWPNFLLPKLIYTVPHHMPPITIWKQCSFCSLLDLSNINTRWESGPGKMESA